MRNLLFAALVVLASCTPGVAADTGISVSDAWLRATPKGATVAGGYATITNKGSVADTLAGASLPGALKGEVHEMSMANGIMRMRRLDAGLPVASGASVALTPGGYHLMFLDPKAPLAEGQDVKGTLIFAKAGAVPVTFHVRGMAAKSAQDHMH